MRTSPVHYIAPSDISITPNANNSANDLAVYVARGAKIKVYSPLSGVDTVNGTYQEWTLSGRNRRLVQPKDEQGRDINTPYTIYARLKIATRYTSPEKIAEAYADGYLIFAPKLWDDEKSEWYDKYAYISPEGRVGHWTPEHYLNYFVRLGDVSIIENGKRTVTLDTGILGTELFNTEWALNPDSMPLRIYLTSMISNQDAGPTPYVYWGQTLVLSTSLIEGWTGTDIQRFDHWEILRDTGSDADTAWNTAANASDFRTTGVIELMHGRGATQGIRDDFNSAVNTTFIVNAMERTDDPEEGGTPTYAVLKSASIDIMAETWEKYEMSLAAQMVTYNPMAGTYSPGNGVKFKFRAIDQKSNVFLLTNKQVGDAGLVAEYAVIDTDSWTAITISGPDNNVAEGTVPSEAFSKNQKSINLRLRNSDDPEHNTGTELFRTTIAFLKDGEDSKEREWIFLRSTEAITFGDASSAHPLPSLITVGQVNPTGAADGSTQYSNTLDGWVPQGWWDEQQGVDATNRFEYGAYRNFVKESGNTPAHWGAFTTPKVWNHFGKDGDDGLYYKDEYARSKSRTSYDAADIDTRYGTDGWGTTAPSARGDYVYIWKRTRQWDPNTNDWATDSSWSYTCLTGENGQKGTDAQYIYLKGTARDEDSETTTTIPCVVNVNGGTNQATILGGLNLVTINRQTLTVVESINYDTYGEAAETGTGITNLIAELNALDNSVFVCLVSYDAVGWSAGLIAKLQEYGMGDLPYTDTGRHPFLFIGHKDLSKGNGLMRMRGIGAYTDVVELSVYVANGALSSHDGQNGADGAKGEDAVNVVIAPASMIVEQDINNKNNIEYAADNNLGQFSIQVPKGSTACTITRIVATASNVYVHNDGLTGPEQAPSSCDWQPNSQIANLYLKGIAKDNQNNYYTTGQIVLDITYTDPDTGDIKTITSIIARVYVNLIGSWSEEVVGDAKTEVAKSLSYAYDPTGQTIIPLESQGQYIKSSTENISILTKKINNGKNLISGVLTGDGWEYGYLDSRTRAFHKTGDAFIDNDGFISRDNGEYSVDILSPEVTFEADTDYCLSFDSKGEDDDDEYEAYAVIGARFGTEVTLTRTGIHYVGTYHSETAGAKRIVFTAYKIFHPQMEIGTVDTAFESGDSEVSSQIKQTADDIRMEVESTGIDITNGKIELRADKTLMRDSNGVEMICFEILDGLPSIVFYDNHGKTGGNKAWVLNWRGLINIMAHTDNPSWDTSKYSREYTAGSTVTARELFYAGSDETPPTGFLPHPDTLYLFHGGYTENSGGTIRWNPNPAIGTDYDSRWFENNNMQSDGLTPAGPEDDPSNAKVNGYHSFPVTIPQGKEVTLYSFEDGIRDVFAIFRIHCMYVIDITTGRPDPSSYNWYIGEVVEGDPGLVSEDGTYITIPEE